MKYKILVTPNFASSDELKVIEHFMLWQGRSYTITVTPEALRYTLGTSQICIIQMSSDDLPVVAFKGFNQFYDWFKENGLIQI